MPPVITALRHAPPLQRGLCAGRFNLAVEDFRARLPALAQALVPALFSRIYASPSARCRDLATELACQLGLALHLDERLVELDFGEWEGQHWDDIEQNDAVRFQAWSRDWRVASPPGGECLNDIETRVRVFLDEVGSEPALLITHAGVIRTIRVLTRSVSWHEAMADIVPYLVPLAL